MPMTAAPVRISAPLVALLAALAAVLLAGSAKPEAAEAVTAPAAQSSNAQPREAAKRRKRARRRTRNCRKAKAKRGQSKRRRRRVRCKGRRVRRPKKVGRVRFGPPPPGLPVEPEHEPAKARLSSGPATQGGNQGSPVDAPADSSGGPSAAAFTRPPGPLVRKAAGSDPIEVAQAPTDLAPVKFTAGANEPSLARFRNVVFYTANQLGAAVSSDGGRTFTAVDSTADLGTSSSPKVDGGFCCDQLVDYSPRVNRFIWVRQTWRRLQADPKPKNPTDRDYENRYRICSAPPERVVTNTWDCFDITPATFNFGGQRLIMDFPRLATNAGNMFLTFNSAADKPRQGYVFRLPLGDLAKNGCCGGQFFTEGKLTSFIVNQYGSEASNRAFFASHVSDSRLRVYRWQDGSNSLGTSQTNGDVAVTKHTTAPSDFTSNLPGTSENWLSRADSDVTGATRTGNSVWFAWMGGKGGPKNFKHTHIEIAIVDQNTLKLEEQKFIYNDQFAFAYPDLATNNIGEVGLVYGWGGGVFKPRTGVGVLAQPRAPGLTQRLLNLTDFGYKTGDDYLTIRRDYGSYGLFTAGTYLIQDAIPGDPSKGRQSHPLYAVFGRTSDLGAERRPGA